MERLGADQVCPNGHTFSLKDGVLSLLSEAFACELDPFLQTFSSYRQVVHERITDAKVYDGLPWSGLAIDKGAWQLRVLDLQLVREVLSGQRGIRVLDIGAWNGWLSARLTEEGHSALAVDYFDDPFDGLGAVQHYDRKFPAIQCDLERLDLLEGPFDLIVVQRCVAFFEDLTASMSQWRSLLTPGGRILLTGLSIHHQDRWIADTFKRRRERYHALTGGTYIFKNVKGYLDGTDEQLLRTLGVALHPYPSLRIKNLLNRFRPSKPVFLYGIAQ
ncbi:MAG: methyltransferase domain-containing protein [Flavobacteriales bacterium]|nr:methyltransferase domain-containing protein [Flavobacteriales bacterium]